MKENIETLKKSIIYKMSLGSKELFHSNVLAWLIENDHDFVKIFKESIDDDLVFDSIAREQKDRDITIHFKTDKNEEKCIVIENKLKSIPYFDQLKKYTDQLGDKFYDGYLLGLIKPNIVDVNNEVDVDGKKWHFISYNDFSKKILKILEQSKNDVIKANYNIIKEYVRNNQIIEEIVNKAKVDNKLIQTWDSGLNDLGLSDLTNKVVGSLFVKYVKGRLIEDKLDNLPYLYISEGFHNKKITLDFRFTNWEEFQEKQEHPYLKIGIQIEGYQYRRMVDRTKDFSKSAQSIFDEFCEKGFFDKNYNKKNKTISFPGFENCKTTTQSKLYDGYGETCVYQYFVLSENELEFETLYQYIKKDILLSSKLMSENSNIYLNKL